MKTSKVKSNDPVGYNAKVKDIVAPEILEAAQDEVIAHAIKILESRMQQVGACLSCSADTRTYLRLLIGGLPHEVFGCVFVDNRHRVIETQELFRGTLNGTAVYPREVVKAAIQCNAAAVVFFHNHPSGVADPSRADEVLTGRLKEALALIDVGVLDHIIVTAEGSYTSFAERGLL